MYVYVEPYTLKEIVTKAGLVAVAEDQNVSGRKFFIANTGAEPLYFKEKSIDGVAATATNAMLVQANTVFPQLLTATTLSLISSAIGTSYAIMFVDM